MKPFYTDVTMKGSRILHRGYDASGRRVHESVNFRPTLYVPTKKPKPDCWTTIDGIKVEPVDFENSYEAHLFAEKYSDVEGFRIYGQIDPQYQFIAETYGSEGELEYDSSLIRVAFIDIECESEDGFPSVDDPEERINVITVHLQGKTHTFALGEFSADDVECHSFDDEAKMLHSFLDTWERLDPDILTGWNVVFFDVPYLYRRIERVLGKKVAMRLSPWQDVRERKGAVNAMGQASIAYYINGIAILDYIDLYKKFTFTPQESYRLDFIASQELGEGKVSYGEHASLTEFYRNDFARFVEYNIRDVNLVVRLEDKLRLIELSQGLAYSARGNFGDVFTQVRMWDSIIYNYLRTKRVTIPPKDRNKKDDQFEGAYVKDPQVGSHDWVASFDLDSLYPHLIMQYNLSPETLVKERVKGISVDDLIMGRNETLEEELRKAKERNLSVAANGTMYRRDIRGFLPELMDTMYDQRKAFKKKMLDIKGWLKNNPNATRKEIEQAKKDIAKYNNFQMVRKVQLNSAFGALGNQYCRYYNLDMAEAITVSGQLSIRWVEDRLNTLLSKVCGVAEDFVIASDTDSVYLKMGCLVDKMLGTKPTKETIMFLDKCCTDVILPKINKWYADLADKMNAYDNKMSMKRECISAKGIWTAKKRYMLAVHLGEDNVYVAEPDLKIMGIETARSSTPLIVRKRLKEAIRIIMTQDEENMRSFVAKFRDEFSGLPVEDVSFPRGCSHMDKYHDAAGIYKKATPIAVKGALIYNHLIRKKLLSKSYQMIREGEKVKFVYLKEPNPVRQRVISYLNKLPPEFGLEGFIDYDIQFDKSFVEPLKTILDTIGWSVEEKSSLDSLFG
jgi:DNA polymerase elongation subunit (family B)